MTSMPRRARGRGLSLCAVLALALSPLSIARASSPPPVSAHWKPIPLLPSGQILGVFHDELHRMILIPEAGGTAGAADLWALDTRAPGSWVLVPTQGAPPPAHTGGAVVMDPMHQRVFVWGGYRFTGGVDPDYWVLDLATVPPTWSGHVGAGTPPPRLRSPAAIYDPLRDRLLIFGGAYDSVGIRFKGDVWALSLGGTPTWSQLPIPGPGPSPRYDGAAIYDPMRDRLVIHGGMDQVFGGPRSDAWALSLTGPTAWTRLWQGAGGQDGQRTHRGFYDFSGDRMLLLGGTDSSSGINSNYHDEVRALPLAVPGPPVVVADTVGAPHNMGTVAAVFDPGVPALFVHGDEHNPGVHAVTWRLDLGGTPAWTRVLGPDVPAPERMGQAQAWDARRNRTLCFGGRNTHYVLYSYWTTYYDDTWSLELGERPIWTPFDFGGNHPPSRQYATLLADPVADRMWLFGGNRTTVDWPSSVTIELFANLYRLDLGGPSPAWTVPAVAGVSPSSRDGHTAVLDSRRHRMIVFGGRSEGPLRNDVWSLSLDEPHEWTLLSPAGAPPPGRMFHVAGYDSLEDRMLVFGGLREGGASLQDLWVLAFSGTPTWVPVATSGTPPTTLGERPGFFDPARRRLVVIGKGVQGTVNGPTTPIHVLSFDPPVPAWSQIPATGAIPGELNGRSAGLDLATGDIVELWGAWNGEPSTAVELEPHRIRFVEVPGNVGVSRSPAPASLSLAAPRPNPARGSFGVSGVLPARGAATVELLDVAGRCREARRLAGTPGRFEIEFSAGRLTPGLYFVRVTQAGRSAATKLVVAR